ncbi:M15 family metallopeptidase [Paraburkholderia sp. SARCC-3016]|uniref:M15 family metallopeptidase n=1 Tax=Paraburkholderia sp. SARCC-3016 TaxID=3058611 RepID=UPI002806EB85|nr:M15 family metallopeptidase [Paraburkholderia sp. SARCC-3016]MDQ7979540.1 M15 family metallopeptidase [Paraburkholderia sp. SARCC-3016]
MNWLSLSDARVSAMVTAECGERLVAIAGLHPRLRIDDSAANIACLGYQPKFTVRETVACRLVEAVSNLPSDYCLLVKEALRPAALQRFYFERRLRKVLVSNPGLAESDAIELTSRFVAPPSVAGHPGGGAIDITLCDRNGCELDLGCAYDADEVASGGACFSQFENLNAHARQHRSLMFAALEDAGFVNYPFEWWHWSYGDKYWAVVKQEAHALYGPIESLEIAGLHPKNPRL